MSPTGGFSIETESRRLKAQGVSGLIPPEASFLGLWAVCPVSLHGPPSLCASVSCLPQIRVLTSCVGSPQHSHHDSFSSVTCLWVISLKCQERKVLGGGTQFSPQSLLREVETSISFRLPEAGIISGKEEGKGTGHQSHDCLRGSWCL